MAAMKLHLTRVPWPTTTTGRALTEREELRAALRTYLDTTAEEVLRARMDDACFVYAGERLDQLGTRIADGPRFPGSAPPPERAMPYWRVGLDALTADLLRALDALLTDLRTQEAHLEFDGLRWWLLIADRAPADEYPDSFGFADLLEESGFGRDPVDGPAFADVAMVAAAVAVTDELAAVVLAALRAAGAGADDLAGAAAALDRARLDVVGAAATMRRAVTATTTDRTSPFAG